MIKLTPEKPPYYENVAQTKTYKAILNQTGTNDPIATVIKNTLGEELIWERIGVGNYQALITKAIEGKTMVTITSGADPFVIQATHLMPENTIAIFGWDNTWTALEGMTQCTIIIEI